MPSFSHITEDGSATMVDVGNKEITQRIAKARATVLVSKNTMQLLQEKALAKGDVLTVAKLAGIMAAKRTHELIPLCHPLALDLVDVQFSLDTEANAIHILTEARTSGKTGVEMEALIAAQIAAATIYDMCKAVQKDMRIEDVRVTYKSGGRSGEYNDTAPG